MKRTVTFFSLTLLITAVTLTACHPKRSGQTSSITATDASLAPDTAWAVKDLITSKARDSFGPPIPVPAPLKARLEDQLEGMAGRLSRIPGFNRAAFKSGIVLEHLAIQQMPDLWIMRVHLLPAQDSLFFYITGKDSFVSGQPFGMSSYYMENEEGNFAPGNKLMSRPYVRAADIDSDGHPEWMVQQRLHDGNLYNAVVTRYLTIDAQLNPLEKARLETKALVPHDTTGITIYRTLSYRPAAHLYTINATLQEPGQGDSTAIGEIIAASQPGGNWRVIRNSALVRKYGHLLLSCKIGN